MPTTLTANYSMQKPEVGADTDQWGYMLNADLDTIDSELFDRLCKTTGGTPQFVTNQMNILECPLAPVNTAGMETSRAANIGWVEWRIKSLFDQFMPVGTIMLWSGTNFGLIPNGWAMCNGLNNTPDLRGRFILCAHDNLPNNAPGNRGGVLSSTPGAHVHYDGGTATSPGGLGVVTANSVANFGQNAATPPYVAMMFIMKYVNWV